MGNKANQAASRLRRWWKLPAGLLLLVVAYALTGFYWVPHLARSQLQQFVDQQLHRQVRVGAIAFNPFTLKARIDQFDLEEADGTPILKFDSLFVDTGFESLWNHAVMLREIRLDNPTVNLVIAQGGSINLLQLLPPAKSKPQPPSASKPLPVRIGTLQLTGGRVDFTDRSRPTPYTVTLQSIQIALSDFGTDAGHSNSLRFSAATSNDERLSTDGSFTLAPLAAKGQLQLSRFKLATVTGWLQERMPLDLSSGTLDLNLQYDFAKADSLQLKLIVPSIRLDDLALAPKSSPRTAPWIRIPSLQVDDTHLSLAERDLSVGSVTVSGSRITAWRDASGSINLQHLVTTNAPAKTTPQAPPAAAPAPWKFTVGPVRVKEGAVDFEDRAVGPSVRFQLAPVNVTVKGVSEHRDARLSIAADLGINQKSTLHADTELQLQPLVAAVKLDLHNFDLMPLQPYIAQSTALALLGGKFSTTAAIDYSSQPQGGQPQLELKGDVEVDGLATKDQDFHQDFVNWQVLKVTNLDFRKGPDSLSIDRIEASKPYGRVTIEPDRTLNVAHILHPARAAVTKAPATGNAKATVSPTKQSMPIRIGEVIIHDGTAHFSDHSVQPSFTTGILHLNGGVKGLSSDPLSRADVQLDGQVDAYSPVSISGQINPLASTAYTDLSLSFRNMELTTFNPYSGKFAGYSITKGKLTTELRYHIENRKLDAQHHIIVDQLEFGGKTESKDAVSLPVKLAVALLKDRNGVIDLDLPVSGSLDDPNFSIMPIIWKTLFNTMAKAVTAPFALLGSLFGGGAEMQFVDFAPGSAELSVEQSDRLQKLAHSLAERPQLKLDIPLTATGDADALPLAQEALDQAVSSQVPLKSKGSAAQQRVDALSSLYEKQFGHKPVFPAAPATASDPASAHQAWLEQALLPAYKPNPNRLQKLGRTRGQAVQALILNGNTISPERIYLTAEPPSAEANKSVPVDKVRMELKLE